MRKQDTGMLVNAEHNVVILDEYASVGIHLSDQPRSIYSVRSMALRPIVLSMCDSLDLFMYFLILVVNSNGGYHKISNFATRILLNKNMERKCIKYDTFEKACCVVASTWINRFVKQLLVLYSCMRTKGCFMGMYSLAIKQERIDCQRLIYLEWVCMFA